MLRLALKRLIRLVALRGFRTRETYLPAAILGPNEFQSVKLDRVAFTQPCVARSLFASWRRALVHAADGMSVATFKTKSNPPRSLLAAIRRCAGAYQQLVLEHAISIKMRFVILRIPLRGV